MTSDLRSDFRRLASSAGVYAASSVAQKGLAFLLIPIYTRFIRPGEYGVLELLTAFSAVAFGILALGLPAAVMKCYHQDADSPTAKARILTTANLIGMPVLLAGSSLLFFLAEPLSRLLFDNGGAADLVRLMVLGSFFQTTSILILAGLRAEERAAAYSTVVFLQFITAMVLNIVFVVRFTMGVQGVLLGNLISHSVALLAAVWLASRQSELVIEPGLARPLLTFGLLMVPAALTGWITDLSDRYILSLFSHLDEVAVYGIGYKFGMVIQFLIVWPFQLAWPALAFSISSRPGHKTTYARTLTYLAAVLAGAVVALSVLSRAVVPVVVGEGYEQAYRVVPLVALGYAFTGIFFCLNPGVHVAAKTKFLPILSALTALLNIGLNFLLIPHYGMMGAAAATTLSFFFSATGVWLLAQRFYPVQYEYSRLFKIAFAAAASYGTALLLEPEPTLVGIFWYLFFGFVAFPLLMLLVGFLSEQELAYVNELLKRRFSNR
ncbi:MAG: oligosaccharide flippase family protein [Thermoanaerobaculia bacterium]